MANSAYFSGLAAGDSRTSHRTRPRYHNNTTRYGSPPLFFDATHDIATVPNYDPVRAKAARGMALDGPRKNLVTYAGKSGGTENGDTLQVERVNGLNALRGKPRVDLAIVGGRAGAKLTDNAYYAKLRNADFCLCPAGYQAWSPRLADCIWFESIPVVLAAGYLLPQRCFWDWADFAVVVPERDLGRLDEILAAYSAADLTRMRARLRELRDFFMPEGDVDSFQMALLELWMRRDVCQASGLSR